MINRSPVASAPGYGLALAAILMLISCAQDATTHGWAGGPSLGLAAGTPKLAGTGSRLTAGRPVDLAALLASQLPIPPPRSVAGPGSGGPGLPGQLSATLIAPAAPYVSVRSDVRIRLVGSFDRDQAVRSLRVEPAVGGRFEWVDTSTLRFQPDRLAFDTTYTVILSGAGGRTWAWQFTTIKPITISIDDCASTPAELRAVLAVLAERHITAVMFPTGICQSTYTWLVPAMLAAGHKVCNHTFSHPRLTRLSDTQIAGEIRSGVHAGCDLFRPPWGDWDGPGGRVARIAAAQGYRISMWDVDTLDWAGASTQDILDRINSRGGVILLHFHGRHTVEALRLVDLQR